MGMTIDKATQIAEAIDALDDAIVKFCDFNIQLNEKSFYCWTVDIGMISNMIGQLRIKREILCDELYKELEGATKTAIDYLKTPLINTAYFNPFKW